MHILGGRFIGYKGHQTTESIFGQGQAGFLPHLPQQAVLRALPLLKLAAYTNPLIMVHIVLLFYPVQHQPAAVFFDVTQCRKDHTLSLPAVSFCFYCHCTTSIRGWQIPSHALWRRNKFLLSICLISY